MPPTLKEFIQAEIEDMTEEQLEEVYEFIRRLRKSNRCQHSESLMAKLMTIKIDAPEDFAENLDLYLSGTSCRPGSS